MQLDGDPALSCAAASIFFQMLLNLVVHVYFSRSLSVCSLIANFICDLVISGTDISTYVYSSKNL